MTFTGKRGTCVPRLIGATLEVLGRAPGVPPGGAAMALRTFHLLFILVAIMGADLFGGWATHEYSASGHLPTLLLGIGCMIGGLGLAAYVIRFVRMMDRERIG
jgi:hypothetical protein